MNDATKATRRHITLPVTDPADASCGSAVAVAVEPAAVTVLLLPVVVGSCVDVTSVSVVGFVTTSVVVLMVDSVDCDVGSVSSVGVDVAV